MHRKHRAISAYSGPAASFSQTILTIALFSANECKIATIFGVTKTQIKKSKKKANQILSMSLTLLTIWRSRQP